MIGKIKKIYSIISTALIILVVAAAFLLAGVRLFGLTPYTVLSGSMEPKYHVGSIIYVGVVEPSDIEVGDPLTYKLANGTVVTHAVVEIIEADDPSDRLFVTQGLANDIPDGSPVRASNIVGKPLFSIPYLGYLSSYVSRPSGMIVVASIVLAALLLSFVPDLLSGMKETASDGQALSEVGADASDKNEKNKNKNKNNFHLRRMKK